jgi:hypothetical protein
MKGLILSISLSILPSLSFHIEITRSKPDRLNKLLFGASHGLEKRLVFAAD